MTTSGSNPARTDGPFGRFYRVGGRELPSVTHILSVISKPALIAWSANQERAAVVEAAGDYYAEMVDVGEVPAWPRAVYETTLLARLGRVKAHQRALAKAADIGTQSHARIEWALRQQLGLPVGPEPVIGEAAMWAVMAWEDWAKAVGLRPILIEQTVYSLAHGYAGTMDLLAYAEDVPTLVDVKTGKAIYPEAYLQTVAYRVACQEMRLRPVPMRGLILRLPKVQTDPEFEVVPVENVDQLFQTFLSVMTVWRWWHEGERAYQTRRLARQPS